MYVKNHNGKILAIIYLFLLNALCDIALGQNVSNETHQVIVRKCRCSGTQVYQTDICKETASDLFVLLWDPVSVKVERLELTSQRYAIQPLSCKAGFSKQIFYEWPLLLRNGKLLRASLNATEDYCIENVALEDGSIKQKIEVCVEGPRLPLCCGKHEFLTEDGRCALSRINGIEPNWPEIFEYDESRPLNCSKSAMKTEPLQLQFKGEVNAMFGFFQHHGVAFCLGQHKSSNGTPNTFYHLCSSQERKAITGQTVGEATQIPFCCPDGQAFDMDGPHECVNHHDSFRLPNNIILKHSEFVSVGSKMNCKDKNILSLTSGEQFIIQADGSVLSQHGTLIPSNEYCLGLLIKRDESVHSGLTCFNWANQSRCSWRYGFFFTCLIISSVFYLLTLVTMLGASALSKQVKMPFLMLELVSLLISQITLLILLTGRQHMNPVECLAAGVIELISVLASYFWLNVMCYDIWTTFRVLSLARPGFQTKKFLKFSAYAWGCPLLIGVVALILEMSDSPLKPNFTLQNGCFFAAEDVARQWGYMYVFVIPISLLNLFFFLHTTIKLLPPYFQNAKEVLNSRAVGGLRGFFKDENFWLGLTITKYGGRKITIFYLKLFFLMGIPWSIEAFTFIAKGEVVCYFWYLDIVNALRGIFLFAIFARKKETLQGLLQICSCRPTEKTLDENVAPSSNLRRSNSPISLGALFASQENPPRDSYIRSVSSGIQRPIQEEENSSTSSDV